MTFHDLPSRLTFSLLNDVTGGGGGAECSSTLLTRKFLLTYQEKRGKEKRENWEEKKENWQREGGKLKMEVVKVIKWGEALFFFFFSSFFFFFFCFSLFKTTEICFGSTKMEIFYREKAFHVGKKIRKNDFASSEKFSSYTLITSNRPRAQLHGILLK